MCWVVLIDDGLFIFLFSKLLHHDLSFLFPQVKVDVVVSIHDGKGSVKLLRAKDQWIEF